MIPPKSEAATAATAERRVSSQHLLDDDECLKLGGGFVIIV